MNLNQELQAFLATRRAARSEQANRIMDEATATLAASGILQQALQTGQTAPDFTLPDALGQHISLKHKLEQGKVVLTFYRGAWCPYCNMQLRALQNILPELRAKGAALLAISPQQPDQALSLIEKHALEFTVLSDAGNHVARQYGLVFTLPEDLVGLYQNMNIDLPSQNSTQGWELPLAATFVLAQDSKVRLAYLNADYTTRLEPNQILAAL
jgi:peroxiredoxin